MTSQVALVVKNLLTNAGDLRDVGLITGLGRSPGGANGNLLQYSCLENSMDRAAWWATVHGVTKTQTQLKQLIECASMRNKESPDIATRKPRTNMVLNL